MRQRSEPGVAHPMIANQQALGHLYPQWLEEEEGGEGNAEAALWSPGPPRALFYDEKLCTHEHVSPFNSPRLSRISEILATVCCPQEIYQERVGWRPAVGARAGSGTREPCRGLCPLPGSVCNRSLTHSRELLGWRGGRLQSPGRRTRNLREILEQVWHRTGKYEMLELLQCGKQMP